ncbi:BH3-interacting domain death agonist isoform X3 [Eubalaena glacialis]|uniref:BH3-interacting domain death agonist isoform X3 n=1 Tax=Eubalaena glacialis TaxID=27606 RepID=UPI002A5A4AD6|nr:BH3-interacting domain death agonist isoform X3 [Eubalaena glacialis]
MEERASCGGAWDAASGLSALRSLAPELWQAADPHPCEPEPTTLPGPWTRRQYGIFGRPAQGPPCPHQLHGGGHRPEDLLGGSRAWPGFCISEQTAPGGLVCASQTSLCRPGSRVVPSVAAQEKRQLLGAEEVSGAAQVPLLLTTSGGKGRHTPRALLAPFFPSS